MPGHTSPLVATTRDGIVTVSRVLPSRSERPAPARPRAPAHRCL